MDGGHEPSVLGKVLIIFQQQLASFLIEGRLREGLYEEAAHNHQHMPQAHVRLPVPLEHVHADLALLGDVRVEDLRQKPPCRRSQNTFRELCQNLV